MGMECQISTIEILTHPPPSLPGVFTSSPVWKGLRFLYYICYVIILNLFNVLIQHFIIVLLLCFFFLLRRLFLNFVFLPLCSIILLLYYVSFLFSCFISLFSFFISLFSLLFIIFFP